MKLYITKPASIHDQDQQAKKKAQAKQRALAWLVQERESNKTFNSFMAQRQRAIDQYSRPTQEAPEDEAD